MLDVLLDDYSKNLEEFMNIGKIAVCFDRSWNQNWNGLRVHSYHEFIEFLYNHELYNKIDYSEIVLGKH